MSPEIHPSPTPSFSSFDINISDICSYEISHYAKEKYEEFYQHYDFIKLFLINNNVEPWLTPEKVAKGDFSMDYYNNYMIDRLPKRDWKFPLDFFEHNEAFYNMLAPYVVKKEDCSPIDFQKLFYLKLRQFADELILIHDFLYYQLTKNFRDNETLFFRFLTLMLRQYEKNLENGIVEEVKDFINDPTFLLRLRKQNSIDLENLPDIPSGHEVVHGNLTRAEILKYFSFLHLEKSENNEPFLAQEAVYDIFKFGIAIPPANIPITSYKLNCSHNFPKGIIEFGIYKFYEIHTSTSGATLPLAPDPKVKKSILSFFAIYFDDFRPALNTERGLDNLNKNITGEQPARMKKNFEIKNYFPDRFK